MRLTVGDRLTFCCSQRATPYPLLHNTRQASSEMNCLGFLVPLLLRGDLAPATLQGDTRVPNFQKAPSLSQPSGKKRKGAHRQTSGPGHLPVGGGGLPREGAEAKNFGMSLQAQGKKSFTEIPRENRWDISKICGAEKVCSGNTKGPPIKGSADDLSRRQEFGKCTSCRTPCCSSVLLPNLDPFSEGILPTPPIAEPKALNLEKDDLAELWNAGSFRKCPLVNEDVASNRAHA